MGVIIAILILIEVVTLNIALCFDISIENRITIVHLSLSIVLITLGLFAVYFID